MLHLYILKSLTDAVKDYLIETILQSHLGLQNFNGNGETAQIH